MDSLDSDIEAIGKRVEDAYRKVASRLERAVDVRTDQEVALHNAVELLSGLEELRAAEEGLRQRNEELDRTRQALERERERYVDLFESAPDGYLVTDASGHIVEANHAAAMMLSVEPRFLHGKTLITFVPGEHRPAFRAQLARLRDVDRVDDWLLDLRPRRRPQFEASLSVAVERAPDGQVRSLRWLIRDVSERARAEEHIRTLNAALERRVAERTAELEAANRAKGDMLSTMSHELRTPINAILGYAELLDTGVAGPLTEQQRLYIERIRASGTHLVGLISEALDLTKVDMGALKVEETRARAADAVGAALALVRPQAAAGGVAVSERCMRASGAEYVGDENRVRQILVNLLSNAVKFTDPGGRIRIRCGTMDAPDLEAEGRLTGSGPWTFVEVEDSGIGIPSEKLAAIFEPFTQVSSGHTRLRGGTGLGLAISSRLARLMGGDITVRSRKGHGSTFTLWLRAPADARHVAAERVTGEYAAASWAASSVAPRRADGSMLQPQAEQLADGIAGITKAIVRRLRVDAGVPRAAGLSELQLEDHFRSYLLEIAQALRILEEASTEPSALLRDGTDIRRFIAERHGVQRFHLGWTEDALRREFRIVREEITGFVARLASPQDGDNSAALALIDGFVDQAERIALRSFRLSRDEMGGEKGNEQ